MNQWEKCPKCEGTGIYNMPLSNTTGCICPVCKGAMIINSFTGRAPRHERQNNIPAGRFITGTAEVSFDDIPYF
jgi:hypothetical protein